MLKAIDINKIDSNPYQPRKNFSAIEELAASIKSKGLLEPITVRPADDRFQLVFGERRLQAAKIVGLSEIDAFVKEISDDEMFELALAENLQRENLSLIEEAISYSKLQEKKGKTQQEIAELAGKTQTQIAHKLRLLKLPETIQKGLEDEKISEGHARQLLRLSDKDYQERLYQQTLEEALSIKILREKVSNTLQLINKQKSVQGEKTNDDNLLEALGCDLSRLGGDVLPADAFSSCDKRETGIFGWMLYRYTNQGDYVGIYGFPETISHFFKKACSTMQRIYNEELKHCSLVFIHFPARCETIDDIVESIISKCKDDTVFISRCGTEQFEIPEVSATVDVFNVIEAFKKHGLKWFFRYAAPLEPPPLEKLSDMEKAAMNNKNLISSYEEWVVIAKNEIMSRDIIYDDFDFHID